MTDYKINTDHTAAVDTQVYWRTIDADTPQGVKVQLINQKAGVATYGVVQRGGFFTHWAPMPRFRKPS